MHVFYSLFIYPSLHLIVHRFVSWSVTGATVLVLASIITRFSSMLTLSVCPSAVVQANSQSLPSNESISIINRSVIESVSLWDRPLVSWLNKKNSSRTRERQSVIITFMLLRLLVNHHLCVTCVLCCFAGHCLSSISPRRPGQITAWETSCRCCRQLSFEDRLSGSCWG